MRPHRRRYGRRVAREPSGDPREMRELGESLSGRQPDIGEKDTGVGKREPPPAPRSSGAARRGRKRPRARPGA